MKANVRKVVLLFLGLVFVGSCSMLIRQMVYYQQGATAYDEAAQLVELPDLTELADLTDIEPVPAAALPPEEELPLEEIPLEEIPLEEIPLEMPPIDPYAEALKEMDFTALREVNEEVLGWIVIPDTNLSYPLLQGEDNDYYLSRTWQKSRNAVGSIFMDYRSSEDLSDFHTIIYGHRMNNESMFGQLHKYRDAGYWEKHPNIFIADDNGSHSYEIFSIYTADSMETYQRQFQDDAEKQNFIDYCVSRTLVDTGIIPEVTDRIITLSTCTGSGHDTRWVVQAVLEK